MWIPTSFDIKSIKSLIRVFVPEIDTQTTKLDLNAVPNNPKTEVQGYDMNNIQIQRLLSLAEVKGPIPCKINFTT